MRSTGAVLARIAASLREDSSSSEDMVVGKKREAVREQLLGADGKSVAASERSLEMSQAKAADQRQLKDRFIASTLRSTEAPSESGRGRGMLVSGGMSQ